MFGKDVLDHFRPRRYWHELAILLGVSGFVVLAILIGGGRFAGKLSHETQIFISWLLPSPPGAPEPAQPVKSEVEVPSSSPMPQAHVPSPTSPAIQSSPTMSAMPFELSDQSGTFKGWPPENGSNQASVSDVPFPPARPDLRIIGRLRKALKPDELNNGNQNGKIEQQDRPVDQTGNIQPQSKTAPKSIKSELEKRKAAAAELEKDYADANVAISTHVSGLNGTVLNLHYLQFDDATVKKIMDVNSFTTALAQAGFKTIIFTGDQNKTWSFPLQPPSPSDTATQGAAPGATTTNKQPAPGLTD